MAVTVTVVGPRRHLSGAAQRSKADAAVVQVMALLDVGDRDAANAVVYRVVHDGVDAVSLFDAIVRRAR